MKYKVYAVVSGSKYLGEYEAKSKTEAEEKAKEEHEGEPVNICWHCSREVEDLTITENFEAEEVS